MRQLLMFGVYKAKTEQEEGARGLKYGPGSRGSLPPPDIRRSRMSSGQKTFDISLTVAIKLLNSSRDEPAWHECDR